MVLDGLREAQRQLPAVGVAEHEDVGARVPGGVEDPQRGFGRVGVAVEEVLGVEENAAAFPHEEFDGVAHHRAGFVDVDPQGAFDVAQVGLRDEGDDRRFAVEKGPDLRIDVGGGAGLAGRAESDESRVLRA